MRESYAPSDFSLQNPYTLKFIYLSWTFQLIISDLSSMEISYVNFSSFQISDATIITELWALITFESSFDVAELPPLDLG